MFSEPGSMLRMPLPISSDVTATGPTPSCLQDAAAMTAAAATAAAAGQKADVSSYTSVEFVQHSTQHTAQMHSTLQALVNKQETVHTSGLLSTFDNG
jgi:hypothetical protein